MALDTIDLYLGPFYGSALPIPEVDVNSDGEADLTDLNRISTDYPIVQNYYYSPFGELWQGERESDTNPFRYAGEYLDKETGNIYLRARYYDPSIGRFISVDPIKDGTNWYVYCSNNPIAFVDPSGLCYWANGEWCHDNWETPDLYREPSEINKWVDWSIEFGVGLYAEVVVNGIEAELGMKSYYDVVDAFQGNHTQTSVASLEVSFTENIKFGANKSTTISPVVGGIVEEDCFVGLQIGEFTIGYDATPLEDLAYAKEDIIFTFEISAYLVVGGGITFECNISEFARQMLYEMEKSK